MKRIIASAGLVAVGAISLQAANAPGLTPKETSKWWSVSAAVRGFYDDNITTRYESVNKRDSYGVEISPSLSLNKVMDQTFFGLDYRYGMKWYSNPDTVTGEVEHSHQFNGKIDHKFSEQQRVSLYDSFVVSQEPAIISGNNAVAAPLKINGSNIRNDGGIKYEHDLSEQVGFTIDYSNQFYDYKSKNDGVVFGGYSALLDRTIHQPGGDLRYRLNPDTQARLGYFFTSTGFTSKDVLALDNFGNPVYPKFRDSQAHTIFLGVDHTFNPKLSGSLRGGAMMVSYQNQPNTKLRTNPYFDGSLTYRYQEGSTAQLGVRHTRVATDMTGTYQAGSNQPLTMDSEATVGYVSVNHSITEKLLGSLMLSHQSSTFRGGALNDQSESFTALTTSLSFEINKFVSVEGGYNYDLLGTDVVARSYHRNYGWIGIKASY
jgi:hypothetical protein